MRAGRSRTCSNCANHLQRTDVRWPRLYGASFSVKSKDAYRWLSVVKRTRVVCSLRNPFFLFSFCVISHRALDAAWTGIIWAAPSLVRSLGRHRPQTSSRANESQRRRSLAEGRWLSRSIPRLTSPRLLCSSVVGRNGAMQRFSARLSRERARAFFRDVT